jgi:hypothetical protein
MSHVIPSVVGTPMNALRHLAEHSREIRKGTSDSESGGKFSKHVMLKLYRTIFRISILLVIDLSLDHVLYGRRHVGKEVVTRNRLDLVNTHPVRSPIAVNCA